MAKYLVTSGSYFQPFTYDELAKPISQAVEAHNAAQDSYDTLVSETEALRQYIMREPNDSEARRMYDSYSTKLANLQNNLWERGYNAGTRRDLAVARAGYASDITRLGTAIKARQDLSNEYWKTKHEHPDMIMSSDPGTESLDKFLFNDRFGKDYYSYSGTQFMNEVGTEAKARASEMLQDPRIKKDPRLVGYLQQIERDGFTNRQVDDAYVAVRSAIEGNKELLGKLDEGASILAGVLMSNLESTGARGNVSATEFERLLDYGKKGLAQAVGSSKITNLQDLGWAQQQKYALENLRYQHNLDVAKAKAAGKGGGSGNSSAYAPGIVKPRGNSLGGLSKKGEYNEFDDKSNVYDALNILNDLKKADGLRDKSGKLVDAANKALDVLVESKYYEKLSQEHNIRIAETDLSPIIDGLKNEIHKAEQNNHYYQFDVQPTAAANIASRVFKPNIQELRGKEGDKIAAKYARYENGDKLNAKDLKSLLESKNLLIGFDGRSGDILLQRNAADDSQDIGKYDDRLVRLNSRRILTGTSAYVNAAQLQYIFDSAIPNNVSDVDKAKFDNLIAALTNFGETIDLRDFAGILKDNYESMVRNGSSADRAVYNAAVEAFALGLFDSSNTPWSPNPYKEGWSAKSGGNDMIGGYNDYDYDDDSYYE